MLFMPGRFFWCKEPGWMGENGRNQVAAKKFFHQISVFLLKLKNVESITKVGQKLSTSCKRFENHSSSSLPNSGFWLFAEICKNVTGKR